MRIAWLEKKRARRGWVALIFLTVAMTIVWATNSALRPTMMTGRELLGADWVLYSDDLPGTWDRLEHSDPFERIRTDAPEVLAELGTALRQATGVRWTPARWHRWLGAPAIISVRGEDVCASFHPGPLTWLGFLAAGLTQGGRGENGLVQLGDLHAGWFDSYLIVGTSASVLGDLMREGEWMAYETEPGAVGLTINNKRPVRFLLRPSDEIDLEIEMAMEAQGTARLPEYLAVEWPKTPIFSARVRDDAIWEEWVSEQWPAFPGRNDAETLWHSFAEMLPPDWDGGADSFQLALFGVDTTDTIPIPDAAVYARSETPLTPLLPPVSAIPYEWSGVSGWMTPWKGEGANLFVVANDRARVFTNEEATMAALMGRERAGRVSSEDASIAIDAPRLAEVLINIARRAAKNELWPEQNADDVEHDVLPWIRAFGALGEIHLEGHYENGPLVLRGGTQAPSEEVSEINAE